MTFHGTPPGRHTGDIGCQTVALRPALGLAPELVRAIRRQRRRGEDPEAIAATLALPVEVVDRALLAMRSGRPERSRCALSVTLEAGAFMQRERRNGEPMWQAFDRLVGELMGWRRRGH